MSDVFPVSQVGVDLAIVNNRKAIIGTVGKEGQDMNITNAILQVFIDEVIQRTQGCLLRINNAVTIGDRDNESYIAVNIENSYTGEYLKKVL